MSRRETPDILGTLMGEATKQERTVSVKPAIKEAGEQAFNKAIKLDSTEAVKQVPVQPYFDGLEPTSEDSGALPSLKEKATFNLSKAMLNDLEDLWIGIRKLRGDKKIYKTDIVEQAVEDAIKDFKLKGTHGKFYGKLANGKAAKQ